MNTNKKVSFLFKVYKKIEIVRHFRPDLRTETYLYECIAQQNNIRTSYYVHKMMEHYFPLKIPINSNTNSREKQPRAIMGLFQLSDVMAAPSAHMPDVTFSKFQFQSTCYEW